MKNEKAIEYCFKCEEPTGCAGRADDSHYNEDGEGPFCWRCWCEDENPRLHERIDQLEALLKPEKPIRDTDKSPVTCPKCKRVDGLMWDARPKIWRCVWKDCDYIERPEKPCDRCGGSGEIYNPMNNKLPSYDPRASCRRKDFYIPCPRGCPPKAKPKDVAEFVKATKIHMEKYGELMSRQWCKKALGIIESMETE